MNDTYLIAFKAISNFTEELTEIFGDKQHSLKLYNHLIERTQIVHEKAIVKHMNAFQLFCVKNRVNIEEQDKKFVEPIVRYSNKVFIDMKQIFDLSDKETKDVIWKHLLTISAIVDTSGRAKKILKDNMSKGKSGKMETNFLTDIISKVEEHVDPNSTNPMEAISSIMSSGVFADLVGGMQSGLENGNLDIGSLMQSVTAMMGSMSSNKEGGGDDMSANMMGMMTTMMSSFGGNLPKANDTAVKSDPKVEEITE